MATTFTSGNPFKSSGTGAGTIAAAGALRGRISVIRWVGATTNAHTATITDGNDNELWSSKAATAMLGVDQGSYPNVPFNGLKVSVLDSGTLYIYTA